MHRRLERRKDFPGRPVGADAAEICVIESALDRLGVSRDSLLEVMLDIRDQRGSVSEAGLLYLADRLRLTVAEVYEVATAYPAVNYGSIEPYRTEADGCDDLVCALLRGGANSHDHAGRGVCRGRCDGVSRADSVRVFDEFRAAGGYSIVERLRQEPCLKDRILQDIGSGNAVGRAGTSFPVGHKWQKIIAASGEPVVIVNADEGELATFKDRYILESDPHGVLEAALVAALVIGARQLFVYLRDDYVHLHAVLRRAIDEVVASGLADGLQIDLRRSGGAYICGEETALIASLEGRPARPRERPPYPTEQGYHGHPTLVHNVETFYRLRGIWGAALEPSVPVTALLDPEAALFSVSGRVRQPGPMLVRGLPTLAALVDEAGGMCDSDELGGIVVGGAAGTIVPARLCDVPLQELIASGLRLGTGSAVVFNQHDDIRWIAARMAGFLARESCGQCSPCRVGTTKMARAISDGSLDHATLNDLSVAMSEASICALGRNAGKFLARVIRTLPERQL